MTAKEADWNTLESLYKKSKGNYDDILQYSNGIKYLKLRTISKKNRLTQIAKKYHITGTSGLRVDKFLKKVFDTLTEDQIVKFIREQYDKDRCSIFVLRFLFEPLVGFEPTTPRLQITCSGQLS